MDDNDSNSPTNDADAMDEDQARERILDLADAHGLEAKIVEYDHSTAVELGGDAVSEVVQRETGVRLRTNVQAGGASERVNVTLETHAQSLPDLVTKVDTHEQVLGDQVSHARSVARRNND